MSRGSGSSPGPAPGSTPWSGAGAPPRRSPSTGCATAERARASGARIFARRGRAGPGREGNRVAGAATASCLMGHQSCSRPAPAVTADTPTNTRKAAPDGHRGDPPPVPRALRAARPHRRAVGLAAARRPQPAVRQRRHGAVQAVLPRPGDAAVRPRGRACRSACAPPTSRTSARPPGTARSSRCAATSPSATTSRRARSSSPGTSSPSRSPTAASGCPEASSTRRVYDDDDEARRALDEDHRPARRADPPARQEGELLVDGRARAGRPVLGDPHRPRPGVRPRRRLRRPRTATWSSGTSCSCRTS